ncbi:VTT domain-containing protein [Hymenobacter sp. BT175]|uniref:TVP38/TMEM64 family protein n=1 Tax=Hymenobacter translucens TaxID=2886507 RepID=UPI001D0E1656|nr:VTT domain-containing protein [Hymenobacter translucens]MCC2546871.1 VTT domain-containing protein [Hymenobacter translucens]
MAFFKELLQKNASTLLSMLFLSGMPLVGVSFVSVLLYQNQGLLEQLTLLEAVLYFVVMAVLMSFALMPTTVGVLITGFYFGWSGFLGMLAAYALASLVGFQVASTLDHGKMTAFLHRFPKVEAVMRELKADSWQLIVLTRISPVTPFALMTFILAVVGVDRRRFLLGSVVGMLPRSLFFYWVGTQASDVFALIRNPETGTIGKILVAVLVLVSLLGLYVLFNNALKRALNRSTQNQLKNQN